MWVLVQSVLTQHKAEKKWKLELVMDYVYYYHCLKDQRSQSIKFFLKAWFIQNQSCRKFSKDLQLRIQG